MSRRCVQSQALCELSSVIKFSGQLCSFSHLKHSAFMVVFDAASWRTAQKQLKPPWRKTQREQGAVNVELFCLAVFAYLCTLVGDMPYNAAAGSKFPDRQRGPFNFELGPFAACILMHVLWLGRRQAS